MVGQQALMETKGEFLETLSPRQLAMYREIVQSRDEDFNATFCGELDRVVGAIAQAFPPFGAAIRSVAESALQPVIADPLPDVVFFDLEDLDAAPEGVQEIPGATYLDLEGLQIETPGGSVQS